MLISVSFQDFVNLFDISHLYSISLQKEPCQILMLPNSLPQSHPPIFPDLVPLEVDREQVFVLTQISRECFGTLICDGVVAEI